MLKYYWFKDVFDSLLIEAEEPAKVGGGYGDWTKMCY